MSVLRRAISGALGKTFIAAVLSRLALLAMTAILGRALGPEDLGVFVFAQGTAVLMAQFAVLGWPTYAMRTLPGYHASGDFPHYHGFLRMAAAVVVVASLATSLILIGIGFWVGKLDVRTELAVGLMLAALLLPTLSLRRLLRQVLAALHRPVLGVWFGEALAPILVALLLLVFVPGPIGAIAMLTIAGFASLLAGFMIVRFHIQASVPSAVPTYEPRSWFTASFHILTGISSRMLLNRTDVILLAPLATLTDTGLYGAAIRLTYLLTFPQIVLSMVMSPRYSRVYNQGNMNALLKQLRLSYVFTLVSTGGLVLPLIVFPERIMQFVYGDSFGEGGQILLILSLSQLAAAIGLPTVSVAMMTDRHKMVAVTTTLFAAANIGLNLFLIPAYGAIGAACTSLVCMVGLGLVQIPWITRSLLKESRRASFRDENDV